MMKFYKVWVATVAEDGAVSVSFHATEGEAWSDILECYEHMLSEEINVTEIRKRIDAMYEDDKDEIQTELADNSVDVKVEEHTIRSGQLRESWPVQR